MSGLGLVGVTGDGEEHDPLGCEAVGLPGEVGGLGEVGVL